MYKKAILFFIIFFFFNFGFSQEVSQRDIKRSGLYYYYQSYDKVGSKAKETARRGLMSLVAQEVLKTDTSNMSDVYINHIKYFVLPLKGEIKVIAYVLKTDITNNKSTGKELNVTEINDTSIIRNDEEVKNEERNISLDSSIKNQMIEQKSNVEKVIEKRNETINKDEQSGSTAISDDTRKELSVLEELVACTTNKELYNKLRQYNLQGKLRYVWNTKEYRKRASAENFNIVLISKETKKIIAFFKKNSLIDLKNNKHITKEEFNQYKQVWIEIF